MSYCAKFGRSRLNGVDVGSAESNDRSMWASSILPFKVTQGYRQWQGSIGYRNYDLLLCMDLSRRCTCSEVNGDFVLKRMFLLHLFNAPSIEDWWKCSQSSIRRDFSWSTSWIRLRYTRSCSFPQIWLAASCWEILRWIFRTVSFLLPQHFN